MAEKDKKAEEVVFGGEVKTDNPQEVKGVKTNMVEVDANMLKEMMQRMTENEAKLASMTKSVDDIFNPLKDIATERTLNVSYYNDKLVVALKGKERVDGTIVYVTYKLVEEGENKGQLRGFITIVYEDETEEEVDQVRFLTNIVKMPVVIKSQKDIGKLVEQGEVSQMSWNGRSLIPTNSRVMTGYKEQRFVFLVDINGKERTLTQDVINL